MHSVGVGRWHALLIAHTVQTGEDIISPGRHIRRQRHLPSLAVIQTTEPQTCWQTPTQRMLIVDPPLSALCVTYVQELDMILTTGDWSLRHVNGMVMISPARPYSGKSTAPSVKPLSNVARGTIEDSADFAAGPARPGQLAYHPADDDRWRGSPGA